MMASSGRAVVDRYFNGPRGICVCKLVGDGPRGIEIAVTYLLGPVCRDLSGCARWDRDGR